MNQCYKGNMVLSMDNMRLRHYVAYGLASGPTVDTGQAAPLGTGQVGDRAAFSIIGLVVE